MFLRGFNAGSPRQPIFYFGGFAVDMTLLLIGIHISSMILCAILMAVEQDAILNALTFSVENLTQGYIWSVFTYPFAHNIASEGIWFAVQMLMFWWFGREVENYIGTSAYGWFYLLLVLIPALTMVLFTPLLGSISLAGSSTIHFIVFMAFVLINPNVLLLFGIPAKWMGVAFMAIYSLIYLAGNAWANLTHLWVTMGVCYFCLQFAGASRKFGFRSWMQERKEEAEVKKFAKRRRDFKQSEQKQSASVDSILEKISNKGIKSLTSQEKAILEEHRAKLVSKERKQP
ncbi:MAG: rhomboid family intramembrane serine protease [Verrucomicrobiota bacterium]